MILLRLLSVLLSQKHPILNSLTRKKNVIEFLCTPDWMKALTLFVVALHGVPYLMGTILGGLAAITLVGICLLSILNVRVQIRDHQQLKIHFSMLGSRTLFQFEFRVTNGAMKISSDDLTVLYRDVQLTVYRFQKSHYESNIWTPLFGEQASLRDQEQFQMLLSRHLESTRRLIDN